MNKPSASCQRRKPTLQTAEVIQQVGLWQIRLPLVSRTIITIKARSVPLIKPHMVILLGVYLRDRVTAPLLDWTPTSLYLRQLLAKKQLWTL
jgi:hypothetical protein